MTNPTRIFPDNETNLDVAIKIIAAKMFNTGLDWETLAVLLTSICSITDAIKTVREPDRSHVLAKLQEGLARATAHQVELTQIIMEISVMSLTTKFFSQRMHDALVEIYDREGPQH